MFPKKRSDFLFACLAASDGKNQRFQRGIKMEVVFLFKSITVQIKKSQCGNHSRSLIPIDKRMIANDMKKDKPPLVSKNQRFLIQPLVRIQSWLGVIKATK